LSRCQDNLGLVRLGQLMHVMSGYVWLDNIRSV